MYIRSLIFVALACALAPSGLADSPATAPPSPARTVSLDLSEGTWMSLDVSPDGEHILFDLLNDIYVMPVSGGTAH